MKRKRSNVLKKMTQGLIILLSIIIGEQGFSDVKDIDYKKLEPEAIVWANPYDGKKLRVLFICMEKASAEAGSVARRLEMDYEVATMKDWEFGDTPERRERWLKLLKKDYDVCVLGVRVSFGGPGEIRYHLMKKATEGMGVVTLWYWHWPFPDTSPNHIMHSQKADAWGQEALPGMPFDLRVLETLARSEKNKDDKTLEQDSEARIDEFGRFIPAGFERQILAVARKPYPFSIMTAQRGKTRMVRMNIDEAGYAVRPGFVSAGTYTPDMYIYDEYHLSLICKAILWAAHRGPAAVVEKVSLQGDKLQLVGNEPIKTPVDVSGRNPFKGVLEYVVHDYYNKIVNTGEKNLSITKGKQTIPLEIPSLDAGNYLVDVWLKRGGKTVDWGSGYFHVLRPGAIASIKLDKEIHDRGQPVEGSVTIKNAPANAKLLLSLEDSWKRTISRTCIPVTGETSRFSIPVDRSVAGIGFRLRADLVVDNRVHFRTNHNFPIRKPAPDYLYNLCMAEDSGSAHIFRIRREALRRWRSDGDNYVRDAFTASVLAWDNLEPNSFPVRIGGSYGYTEETVREWCENAKRTARELTPYGARFFNLGDDSGPSWSFGKDHAGLFQEYLKKKYGTIEKLKKGWVVTAVTSWEEITQEFVDDQKAKKNYIPATESHRFGEDLYYSHIQALREAAQSVNSDIAVGQYASDWGAGLGQFLEAANYFCPYWRDYMCETVGAFYGKMKGYYGGNGGYPGDHFQPWYPLFSGCNKVSNWYMPARLLGDLTLVEGNRQFNENALEIKQGIGMQVIRTKRHTDPVAILYSRASGWASALDSTMAEIDNSRENANAILHDLGLQYIYIYNKHLFDGVLRKEGIKLLILPYCQALSEKEAEVIRTFVKAGGTVLADVRPAVWDERCKQLEKGHLDEVFGITRKPESDYIVFGDLKLTSEVPGLRAGEVICSTTADKSVSLTTAKPYGELGGVPTILINKFGKGTAVLLNTFIGRYKLLQADGESLKLNRLYRWLVQQAGIQTDRVKVTSDGHDAIALRRVHLQNGSMEILGACKRGLIYEEYPVEVAFDIPEERHIYEMRGGRYLGYSKKFKDRFEAEHVKFYTLLPYKVEGIEIKLGKEATRGQTLLGKIEIKSKSREISPHAMFLQVKGPDGEYCDYFEQKLWVKEGKGTIRLPIAFNEACGKYEVYLKDIPTGQIGKASFKIR